MIKMTKIVSEANAITHDGVFHGDEVLATVILEKVFQDLIICRTDEVKDDVLSNVIVYDASVTLSECANDPTVTANPMIEASQATLIQNTRFYVPVKIKYFSTDSTEDISITAYNNLWIGLINRTGGVGVGSTYITVEDNPYYDIPLHFKVRAGFICEKTSSYHTNSCYIELLNNSDNGYIEYCDYSQAYNDETDEEYWVNDNDISGYGDDVECTYSDWLEGGDWYDGP